MPKIIFLGAVFAKSVLGDRNGVQSTHIGALPEQCAVLIKAHGRWLPEYR